MYFGVVYSISSCHICLLLQQNLKMAVWGQLGHHGWGQLGQLGHHGWGQLGHFGGQLGHFGGNWDTVTIDPIEMHFYG